MKLNALSIRMKIIIASSVFLATIATLSLSALFLLADQKSDGVVINIAGRQRMLSQKMTKEALLLQSADTDREQRKKALMATINLFDRSLSGLIEGNADMGLPPAQNPPIKEQLLEVKNLWSPFHQAALALTGDIQPDSDQFQKALEVITANNLTLLKEMNRAVGMMAQEAGDKVGFLEVVNYLGLAVGIAMLALVLWLAGKKVVSPLRQVVHDLDQMTQGDLRPFSHQFDQGDEIAQVSLALEELRKTLHNIIGMVRNKSLSLSDGASSQAASIEENSASMEEISAMAKTSADNSGQADQLTAAASQVVDRANQTMTTLRQAMDKVSAASDETAKIVKSIDEVAFQTNLLALNAAVEAARAGEAGAGFAVVADEVRNLALRAAEAARNTQALIEENLVNIKESTTLVGATDEELHKVQESTTSVAGLVSEIAAASQEQVLGVEQVNAAINEIDKVAQGNALVADEMAQAMNRFVTEDGDRPNPHEPPRQLDY